LTNDDTIVAVKPRQSFLRYFQTPTNWLVTAKRSAVSSAAATGLEPATSGVTGVLKAFQRASPSRQGRQIMRVLAGLPSRIFRPVAPGRFHHVSSAPPMSLILVCGGNGAALPASTKSRPPARRAGGHPSVALVCSRRRLEPLRLESLLFVDVDLA
jgi:hypothetical protein